MGAAVRLRTFLHRRRRGLAAAYLAGVALFAGAPWAYVAWVPDDVDLGLAIAARAWCYRATFEEVERAERDAAPGGAGLDAACRRLERFLARHARVQPAQLDSHATARAAVLLAELWTRRERPARGAEAIAPLLERLPLDHTLWWAHGRALAADGELAEAAKSLRRAFELTLHHAGVADDYLAVLAEQNRFDEIAAVAGEWERAQVRAAPRAILKAGIPRRPIERRILAAVGIDVEQGRFFRHFERWPLERGVARTVEFPPELFEPWPWRDELVVQMRVENAWDGVHVAEVEVERRDGRIERRPARAGTLHRPGSGAGAWAEVFTGVPGDQVRRVALVYDCPGQELAEKSRRAIAKARANVAAAARSGTR